MEYLTLMIHDMEVREEGRAEGRLEGRAEGRAEGRTEGRDERSREIYERLIAGNMSPEQARAIAFG